MARYIYYRVSTSKQSFERQEYNVKRHFATMGMDYNAVDGIVMEKISSRKELDQRKLSNLFDMCGDGDVIYVASLDRIGRNQVEMVNLIDAATKKGITVVTCDDGRNIENKSEMGTIWLAIASAFAQAERNRIQERTQDAIDAIKEEIASKGCHVTKKGRVCHKLGREKGCDLSAATAASCKARSDAALTWRSKSKGYQWVRRKVLAGWTNDQIIEEFNDHHAVEPEDYSTPNGCALTVSTLNKWRKEIF